MKTTLRKPCKECPFRRASPGGWLGPWNPADLLRSLAHTPFPCHRTIVSSEQSFDDPKLQGCAGAAIFLNNKLELIRCPETARHQAGMRDLPAEVRASVFARTDEFLSHHGGAR